MEARKGDMRGVSSVSLACTRSLFTHYFQAPAMQATSFAVFKQKRKTTQGQVLK